MQHDILQRRRIGVAVSLSLIIAITYGAMLFTQYDTLRGFAAIPRAFSWAIENFIPDVKAFERLPRILEKLLETVLVSVSSATTASFFGFLTAILGSDTTRPHPWFSLPVRGLASIFRNIDVSVWALILLFSFGQSGFTGFFALFFVTYGFVVRVMVETIDEIGPEPIEALRATGAGYGAIITQSVIPASLPQLISWVLFMIETNIRSATLVGILTGTGIGFSFDLYFKSMNYSAASLVVLVVVIAVLAIEALSNAVRRAVL